LLPGLGTPGEIFHPKSYFWCDLKPHAKIQNPTITPSGRKVSEAERKKKEGNKTKNAFNSGHLGL
jgi:hypothetical protein